MNRREELHDELVNVLGSDRVYFQAPSNRLKYPAIVYSLDNADTKFADSIPYLLRHRYQVSLLTMDPDDELIDKIAMSPILQRIELVNHFVSENIHHYIYKIYF